MEYIRLVAPFCAFKKRIEDTLFMEDFGNNLEDSYAYPDELTESIITNGHYEPIALLLTWPTIWTPFLKSRL
jgi:hypothetical protein